MPEDQESLPTSPITIKHAALPADAGLSGLGLVMSLAGGIFCVAATSLGVMALIAAMLGSGHGQSSAALVGLLVAALSAVRSWAHRAAGARLLYDGLRTPRSALRRYFVFAALQTVVVLLVAVGYHAPAPLVACAVVVLASWPVALAIALRTGRFPELLAQLVIPRGEDNGFEGAAILMVVLGLTGLLCGVVLAIGVFGELGRSLKNAPGFALAMLAIVAMLLIRSWIHVSAGLAGVRQVDNSRAVAAATSYSKVGVGTSFGIAIVFMLIALSGAHMGPSDVAILFIFTGLLFWGLGVWPRIIRRFYAERQLTLDGNDSHTRAPDRGLATLGWLLFGQAVMSLAMSVPVLVVRRMITGDVYYSSRDPLSKMLYTFQASGGAQIWSIVIAALQLVIGWQLIQMRPNHKRFATIWAIAATLVAIYINYPMMRAMFGIGVFRMFGDAGAQGALGVIVVASSLIAPIVTLILVRRPQRDLPAATVVAQ